MVQDLKDLGLLTRLSDLRVRLWRTLGFPWLRRMLNSCHNVGFQGCRVSSVVHYEHGIALGFIGV